MDKNNLISFTLSPEEEARLNSCIGELETLLASKFVNLTPDERKEYGRAGHRTENWITKVHQYIQQYPDLVPRHVDVNEFNNDYRSRTALMPYLRRLEAVVTRMDDTGLLLGSDLYTNALMYYRNLKVLSAANVPNAKAVEADLKQQFPAPSRKKAENTAADTPPIP